MSKILDTLVVAFGEEVSDDDAANFYSRIALDDSLNKDTAGKVKKSFNPADDIHIMCQLKAGWVIQKVEWTSGEVVVNGLASRTDVMERTFFVDTEKERNLNFYPSGGISGSPFYGKTCTFLSGEDRIVIPSSAPVMVDLSYPYIGYSLTIHTPNMVLGEDDSWPIGVVIWVIKS